MDSNAFSIPEQFNIAGYLLAKNPSAGFGSRVAFIHEHGVLTFDEVLEMARRTASLLLELGVQEEQRVVCLLEDTPELVAAFWGSIWAGAVAVPVNTASSAETVRFILRDSRARVLVTCRKHLEQVLTGPVDSLKHVVLVDEVAPELAAGVNVDVSTGFMRRVGATPPLAHPAATLAVEQAFWLYTSGSTGKPKAVVHAHKDIVPCAIHYGVETLGLCENDVCFSVAKIPFAYGLGATMYLSMWVGASAVLSSASNAFDVAEVVRRVRPTVFFGIPSVYAALLAAGSIADFDASSLRLCVSAAERLPESVFEAFEARFGLQICEGMGTTEFLHVVLSNRPGQCRPGSCGRPVPGYTVQIVDELGRPLGRGGVGDLEVSGPSLMIGYWNRPEESRRGIYGGAMRTGDKYEVDLDGMFHFKGRTDDLFKVNGQWVVPSEVEACVLQHEAVLECAVVLERTPGAEFPEVCAYVTLRPEAASSEGLGESIRRWVKSRVQHYKAPRQVCIVDAMPRTVTGKIDRRALSTKGARHELSEGAVRADRRRVNHETHERVSGVVTSGRD